VKVISTLNFKGGVGKTTVAWLLGRYLAERLGKSVLVIDADPQMSLTTAVQLLDTGYWDERFRAWRDAAKNKGKTLYQALKSYDASGAIDLPVDADCFYQQRKDLQLLPSDDELYWFELEAPKGKGLLGFMPNLLKIRQNIPTLIPLDYCIIDCPPAFNSLSFSAVSCSDLVLVPINPDVFASFGVRIMLSGLKTHLAKLPKFVIFMNRAKIRKDPKTTEYKLTKEGQGFLDDVAFVALDFQKVGVPVRVLQDFWIPERVDIKRALAGRRLPPDMETYFAELWDRVEKL
jgi:chromosome partitioning protein